MKKITVVIDERGISLTAENVYDFEAMGMIEWARTYARMHVVDGINVRNRKNAKNCKKAKRSTK